MDLTITKEEFESVLYVATSKHMEVFESVQPHIENATEDCIEEFFGSFSTDNAKVIKCAKDYICVDAFLLVFRQLDEYFAGTRKTFDFPYRVHGTPFQEAVWAALREIPYGETRSYKDIAEAIGHPKAFRAVGMANHANPIFIAIPCHRVIGAGGSLVGYGGGLGMKQALLELEKANSRQIP